MVAWLTPSGSGAGTRTDGTRGRSRLFPGQPEGRASRSNHGGPARRAGPRSRRACCTTGRYRQRSPPRRPGWTGCRNGTGRPPGARPGDAGGDQVGHEIVVVLAGAVVPLHEHHLTAESAEVRHADPAPLGVGPTVHQHRVGVLAEQPPALLGRDVSCIAHARECPQLAGSGRTDLPVLAVAGEHHRRGDLVLRRTLEVVGHRRGGRSPVIATAVTSSTNRAPLAVVD